MHEWWRGASGHPGGTSRSVPLRNSRALPLMLSLAFLRYSGAPLLVTFSESR
jgi:hypothetical protein